MKGTFRVILWYKFSNHIGIMFPKSSNAYLRLFYKNTK